MMFYLFWSSTYPEGCVKQNIQRALKNIFENKKKKHDSYNEKNQGKYCNKNLRKYAVLENKITKKLW